MSEEIKGIDAHIDAALDAADAPSDTVTTVAATEQAPVIEDAPQETAAEARARDEKGRFAAKTENSPPTAPDATPEAAPVESTEVPADPKPEEAQAWTDGHFRGWSPERRQAFEKLPREAQTVAMDIAKDLQADFTRKTTEAAEWRKRVEPVLSALASENDLFEPQGLNPVQAFKNYANIERTLTYGNYTQKLELVSKICETYGIPFNAGELDPYQASLHDHNAAVAQEKARSAQLERQLSSYQQQQLNQTIEAFASATNADGTPAHPHFEAVKPAMSALLTNGKARTLDEAYAMASKPIEDLIAAKAAEARQKVEVSQREAVEKAKRAAPVRSSTNSMPNGKTKPSGMDAVITAALDSHGF